VITWVERAKAATAQNGRIGTAKTDETHISRLTSVLAVPPPAILGKHDFAIGMIEDPERWCGPKSSAMTGADASTVSPVIVRDAVRFEGNNRWLRAGR
jgi:hypothetical protein